MSKIWFTSDTHYDHSNIASKSCSKWDKGYRDFKSLEEHNETIVNNINKLVSEDDTLYHLGDWSFGGIDNIWNFRKQLNCKNIHLILGNHDEHIRNNKVLTNCILSYSEMREVGAKDLFTSIQDTLTVKHGKHIFFLSHYSHRVWYGSHKGIIHLYGHSHNTIPDYGKSMDVGIDVAKNKFGEYRPFSIEEIISIMDNKQIEFVDHHDKNTNIK